MRRIGVLVAVVLFGTTLTAAVPEYQAIRAAGPDGRVSVVNNLILERDVYRLEFRSGAFHFRRRQMERSSARSSSATAVTP
jgi:hypothetical protein